MPNSRSSKKKTVQRSLINYLLQVWEQTVMTKDGAQQEQAHEASSSPFPTVLPPPDHSEYAPQLTKAYLENSLSVMYDRLAPYVPGGTTKIHQHPDSGDSHARRAHRFA